jgi:plasmid stabilization system protein ParE
MKIIRTTTVSRDLSRYADRLSEDRGLQTALRFVKSFEESIERLSRMPLAGSLIADDHPRLNQVRWIPVRKFPHHLIFYLPIEPAKIRLLRIAHSSMDIMGLLEHCDINAE